VVQSSFKAETKCSEFRLNASNENIAIKEKKRVENEIKAFAHQVVPEGV